MYMSW